MNDQMQQISARIRELREILELTQEQVAADTGIALEDYKSYE